MTSSVNSNTAARWVPWSPALVVLLFTCSIAAAAVVSAPGGSLSDVESTPADLTRTAGVETALRASLPIVRESLYVVNARVRPLLLFWIGRDDVGNARVTWRANGRGRHAIELLIGSDPARAPRRINRWGYIKEEVSSEGADVLGVMKASNEETLDEAKTRVEAEKGGTSTFKAVRTTIRDHRASSGTVTLAVPSSLTYHDLDTLLAMIPVQPPVVRTTELPTGVLNGFLVAMEAVMSASVEPCRARDGAKGVQTVAYLYNHTLYDLSLRSCAHRAELRTATATYSDVIEGRFHVRNRTTTEVTSFAVAFGTAGELQGLPIRAEFRPRWWMEVELVLDRAAAPPSTGGQQ